jgi:Fe-S cluster biogenesis protein NfuA
LQRIDPLVQQIEQSSDPAAQSAAREMIRLVLDLHAAGLARMLELLSTTGKGSRALLDAWAGDELVRSLLLLHDLHPEGLDARVEQALEKVRPLLHSHGGDVELLSLSDGVVRLRMRGSCHGCPSSAATLKHTIEQAIYEAAPDVAGIELDEAADPVGGPAALVQLSTP